MTSLQLLSLFVALHKARTRKEKFKAVCATMSFQSHQMEVPVFRSISIHPSHDPFIPHLLASLRQSPTGDLDPLHSAINLRILYRTEKRFKEMFRLSRNVFETVLNVLSPYLIDGVNRTTLTQQAVPRRLTVHTIALGKDSVFSTCAGAVPTTNECADALGTASTDEATDATATPNMSAAAATAQSKYGTK